MFLKSSIATKLSICITILIAVSLLLFSFFSFFQINEIINLQIEEKAVVLAQNLSLNSQYAINQGDIKNLQALTDSILTNKDVIGSEIRDATGEILAYTYAKQWDSALKKKESFGLLGREDLAVHKKHILLNNKHIIETSVNIFFQNDTGSSFFENKQRVGIAILYLSTDQAIYFIRKLKMSVLGMGFLILLLGLVGTIFFVKRFTRTINDLVVGTLELKHGNLDYRVQNKSNDEIGQLAQAFNVMSDNLKVKIQELDSLNKDLGERVKDRTEQLKQVNLKLRGLQEDVMNSAKVAALGEMGSKIIDDISDPLLNIMLVFHNEISKLFLIERRDAVKGLRSILLLWHQKYQAGELETLLSSVKDGEKIGDRSFKLLIDSLDLLVRREEKALDLFTHLELQAMKIFTVTKELKESLDLDKPMEHIDVRDMLDEVVAALGAKINKQKVRVERNYAEEELLVHVCVEDIMQVFFNVLLNSLQSLDGIASKPKIYISAQEASGMVEIKIYDNGCGIAQEHKDKIFDPGFSTKSGEIGVGFGLAICKRYLSHYGGEIILKKSEPLVGTTFLISIPVSIEAENLEEDNESKME